ncbi:MAG: M56 family metallopeptidase [Planctomycetes bacterium]|nr:M56 family metallopeptidase [Planctomycetota bacterium]
MPLDAVLEVAAGWWAWMQPMLWQGSVLILLVFAADRLLARWAWPQLRLALWLSAAAKLLLPPTVASPLAVTAPLAGAAALAAPPADGAFPAFAAIAFAVWCAVAISLAFRAARTARRTRRALLASDAADLHAPRVVAAFAAAARDLRLRRLPRLLISDLVRTPAAFGVLRPLVILPPRAARDLDGAELRHVFLHELAHVKRGDLLLQGFLLALHFAYWFNPLVLVVRRRIAGLLELCCDASVAAVLREECSSYRRTLLREAERLLDVETPAVPCAIGMIAGASNVIARLYWLERRTWRCAGLRRALSLGAALAMFLCVLPMAQAAAPARAPAPAGGAEQASDAALDAAARSNLERVAAGDRISCLIVRYSALRLSRDH